MNEINYQPIILAILATAISFVLMSSCYARGGQLNDFSQCRSTNVSYRGDCLELRAPQQQNLFLLQNCSRQVVYIRHANPDCAQGAGWDSKIDPHNMSAFALDINDERMQFQCFIAKKSGWRAGLEHYQQVACCDVLNVCQQQDAQFTVGNEGSYWVAENYSRALKLARHIHLRGIDWQG